MTDQLVTQEQKKDKECSVPGCDRKHYGKGYCKRHYNQVLKHGVITDPYPVPSYPAICKVEDCNRKHYAKGYCNKHWRQIRTYGKILGALRGKGPNGHKFENNACKLELYDQEGNVRAETIIDAKDYDKIKNLRWHIGGDNKVTSTTLKSLPRIILGLSTGDSREVDHKNGDRLDNTRANIRICNRFENARNCKKPKNNTSGYKGVSWSKHAQKWAVQIKANHKSMHLGYFDNILDAALAYNQAARTYHGEFARLNYLDETIEK